MREVEASFVIPAYNASSTIVETLNSLSCCGVESFEVIVVDDGSNDNTFDVALSATREYNNKVIRLPENIGSSTAMNFAISLARGRYVARLDADDICCPGRLRVQIEYLEKNDDIAFCGGTLEHFGTKCFISTYPVKIDHCIGSLPAYCCFGHPSVTFDMSRMRHQLNYDASFKVCEDYNLWSALCRSRIFGGNVDFLCTKYRRHDEQISLRKKELVSFCDYKIRNNLLSNMLEHDDAMSSIVFAIHLTQPIDGSKPEFVKATLDLIEAARPTEDFRSSWKITQQWLRRTLVNADTSGVSQKSVRDLTNFALLTHGRVARQSGG